jgi:flagellar motor switch protein FliM
VAEAAAPEVDLKRINLADMQGPGNWRLDNFDIILDAFAQNLSVALGNRIQRAAQVQRSGMDSTEFGLFGQSIADKSVTAQLRLDPVRWGGLLVFDPTLAYVLVEILAGGSSEGTLSVPKRAMTPIELSLVRGIATMVCPELAKAFRPLEEIDCGLVRTETNPRLVKLVPADAGVLVATFDISIEKWTGKLRVVIPHQSLEPYRDKLIQGAVTMPPSVQSGHWRQVLKGELMETPVHLTARAATVTLRVRDILALEEGDIIDLGVNPDAPLDLLVQGKAKFKGLAGLRDGRKAVRLTGCIL